MTAEPTSLRDPEQALALALQAVEVAGDQEPKYIVTLARAYYATGDTATAVRTWP